MASDTGDRNADPEGTLHRVELIAGGIAHDFNNLLQTIRARLDLTLRAGGLTERQAKHLEVALRCAQEAETLSAQLRVLARAGEPRREEVNVQSLVERAVARYFENGDFTHGLQIDPTAQSAMLDPTQMSQVFDNLLHNARQAMPSGGRVEIRVDRVADEGGHPGLQRSQYLRIRVSDNGPGIGPEELPRIFESDFTTKDEGTGMGLSICQGVVRRHGGRLTCESALGQGTTFTILLPLDHAGP